MTGAICAMTSETATGMLDGTEPIFATIGAICETIIPTCELTGATTVTTAGMSATSFAVAADKEEPAPSASGGDATSSYLICFISTASSIHLKYSALPPSTPM